MTAEQGRATTGDAARDFPDGIDPDRLSAYLGRALPTLGRLLRAEMIGVGRSNLTYRLHTENGTCVLRRPPLGHVLPTAHDMGREYRFLAALAPTDVPVPHPLVLCDDTAVLGAPFYVMEYRPGFVTPSEWPEDYGGEEGRARACSALVRTLGQLHGVDWRVVGLADFARPGNYVERQLKRLGAQYDLSNPDDLPAFNEVRARLQRAVPPEQPPAIVHGDFGIHNVILAPDDPGRIAAVLDWEMATIGDPLADLGWMLALWAKGEHDHGPAPSGTFAVTALDGMWTRERVVTEYGRLTGRDMSHVEFYYVLGLFKLVVIWQGIHARYVAGATRGEGFEVFRDRIPEGAERALAAAEASSVPPLRGAI
jgi:aminoglycoside phosphotransferase (APT) family kinase protein